MTVSNSEDSSPPASPAPSGGEKPQRASLFITCLVDFFFPRVGESMVQVLRHFDVDVTFTSKQTCCGQPAFNAGFREESKRLALHFLEVFESADDFDEWFNLDTDDESQTASPTE